MSIRMYNYRCQRSDLWDIHTQVRDWAMLNSSGALAMMRAVAEDFLDRQEQGESFDPIDSKAYRMHETWTKASEYDRANEDVSIQIFEEPDGTMLLRFLSNWHPTQLVAAYEKDTGQTLPIEPVFCQNSTDMDAEDVRNQPVASWVDRCIDQKRYMVIPIYTASDAWHLMFAHHEPENHPWLEGEVEAVKVERDNPQPLTDRQLRMFASMTRRSLRSDYQSYEHLLGKMSSSFAATPRGRALAKGVEEAYHLAIKLLDYDREDPAYTNEEFTLAAQHAGVLRLAITALLAQANADEALKNLSQHKERAKASQ